MPNFQEILSEFASIIEDPTKVNGYYIFHLPNSNYFLDNIDLKVTNQLGIALVEGIEFGRLRQVRLRRRSSPYYVSGQFQGTSGKKNWNNYWLQENAKKRKTMMDKWLKDPSSVGDASTSGGEVIVAFLSPPSN